MREKLVRLGMEAKDLFAELTNQMDELLSLGGSQDAAGWVNVQVTKKDDKIVIRAELPGFEKENISINVTDDVLIVKGEYNKTEEVGEVLSSSIKSFERKWELPNNAIVDEIEADIRAGILAITVPLRAAKTRSKEIPIG